MPRDSIRVFDLHCDTLYECLKGNRSLYDGDLSLNVEQCLRYPHYLQALAVWIPDDFDDEQAIAHFRACYALYKRELAAHPNEMEAVNNRQDLQRAAEGCRPGFFLTVEGGRVLGTKLSRLDELSKCGVKILTLTWNGENAIGGGCLSQSQIGLTPFGRQVVSRCEELGITVDVSHLSDRGFWDLCEIARKPFIATHSNARAVCSHPRNLTDEQFVEICRRRGVVGLNFYTRFVTGRAEENYLDRLVAHIDHFCALGGTDCLCLGSDYDGAEIPDCLGHARDLGRLYNHLLKKGYKEEAADKIFFVNACRFFSRAFDKPEKI